jgi:arylsulfatase A-like enzyme
MRTDDSIGQVLRAVQEHGLAESTLFIVTSDNGCSPQAKFDELLPKGHNPSHVFRGHKADIYEGGHRVPLIVRWPGKVPPGTHSDQIVCLTDLMATTAAILGASLPDSAGEDSVNILPALLGHAEQPLREAIVHHSINGSFSIRQGSWKLALCPDSGGWSAPRPGRDDASRMPNVQLFDMSTDVAEQNNLAPNHPDVVSRLTDLLARYVAQGRSTPGSPQSNAVTVDIRRAPPPPREKYP